MGRLTRGMRKLAGLTGVYRVYEKMLEKEVMEGAVPSHVAVILDGNRRWARERGLDPLQGYEYGARKVEDLLKWCYDLSIRTVSLYILSTENLERRSPEEISTILGLLRRYLSRELEEGELVKRGVRVKAIGDPSLLPPDVRGMLGEVEERTSRCDRYFLNIAVAYGGRKEIVEAVKALIQEVLQGRLRPEDIDEGIFEEFLQTSHLPNPYPDLVIRTSGELRISNFMLWQIAYSELVFIDVYWPEFRRVDLLRAIRTFQRRSRRFGA